MVIRLIQFVVLMLTGVVIARVLDLQGLESSALYLQAISLLLAIGLYGSTYGIDLSQARAHLRLILLAVTIGVVCKAAIIGVSLWLAFDDPRYLILGVAVAQIDPLSVAVLSRGNRMSKRVKSILGAWSSFDDPVTALLTIYATTLLVQVVDFGDMQSAVVPVDWSSYFIDLGLNGLLVGCAFALYRIVRPNRALEFGIVGAVTVIAVERFLMLGQAVTGLFERPNFGGFIERLVAVAFGASAVMLGLVLAGGIDVTRGIALGSATFAAQIVVAAILTRGLPRADRVHLAFAQQNGITAIILALLLEAQFDGVIAVVAPAIITVNFIHLVVNTAIDLRQSRTRLAISDH